MNSGKTVFAQTMDFLPLHEFRKCVTRYRGHHKVKSFSCLDQFLFLCMAFGQLTYRESLRDIETCFDSPKFIPFYPFINFFSLKSPLPANLISSDFASLSWLSLFWSIISKRTNSISSCLVPFPAFSYLKSITINNFTPLER